jgi:hypothetical protein
LDWNNFDIGSVSIAAPPNLLIWIKNIQLWKELFKLSGKLAAVVYDCELTLPLLKMTLHCCLAVEEPTV